MGNPHPTASWKPGQVTNPNGRPVGARNNRTKQIVEQIVALGHKDPLVTLSELQHSSSDESIRANAANMLAPFLHSKNATKPVAPDPVYIQEAISLPRPTSISQATDNIAKLSEMKATGLLDFATADSLINDQKVILNALIDEQKLLTAQGGASDQTIRIENALPQLPGTSIIWPKINGNEVVAISKIEGPEPPDPADYNADPRPGSPPDYNAGGPATSEDQ